MHIKKRGDRAMLYRSSWVRKGAEGNTHGYSRQVFVGSLPLEAQAIPPALRERLSADEVAYVTRQVTEPARRAEEARRHKAEQRSRDPLWRLEEAATLIREAASLSVSSQVPQARVAELREAANAVKTLEGPSSKPALETSDPLGDALQAIRAAAHAVREGHYGDGPAEGVRSSSTYAAWMAIVRAIEGTEGPHSLLRALQSRGWVKAKGR